MKIIFYIFTIYPLRFAFLVLDIAFKAIPLKILKLVPSFKVTRKNLSIAFTELNDRDQICLLKKVIKRH